MELPEYRAANETSSLGERLGTLHRQLLADVPQVDRIGCALYDPDDDLLKTFVHSTLSGEALRGYEYKLSASRSLLDLARRGGRRLLTNIPDALEPHTAHSAWVIEEGYRTSLTIPMYGQGAFTGMLFFDSRRPNAFSGAEQRHLELYANLVSLLIAGELLTIRALAGSVDVARAFCDLRDFETGAHLDRMSRYARIAAKELAPDRGLTDEFVELVFLFAPLHDVGKIGIPDHILLRPGPLAGADWETMKTHVNRGSAVLDQMIADLALRELPHVALLRNIVAYHHEFLDGSGYPQGARGDAIPLEARIVTVADVFDALTSPRPYKAAWPFPEAFAELDRMVAAGKLDAAVVDALQRRSAEVRAVRERYFDDRKGAPRP